MAQFFSFPACCAVQVLGSLYGKIPDVKMDQKHVLTIAVLMDSQEMTIGPQLLAKNFKKILTFNAAHSAGTKLHLYAAGGEFVLEKEK